MICIDKKASVLDEVAIDFTLNLYQLVLNGMNISKAFEKAMSTSAYIHKDKETDIFKLFTQEYPFRAALM